MILRNNNSNNFQNSFNQNFNRIKQANEQQKNINAHVDTNALNNNNVLNKNDMADKSLAMLQQRLDSGLITLEDFKKQCEKINKIRNNN